MGSYMSKETLSQKLSKLLNPRVKARKLDQRSLGKTIGVSQKTVSNYLNGKSPIDLDSAYGLCETLGIQLWEWLRDNCVAKIDPAHRIIDVLGQVASDPEKLNDLADCMEGFLALSKAGTSQQSEPSSSSEAPKTQAKSRT